MSNCDLVVGNPVPQKSSTNYFDGQLNTWNVSIVLLAKMENNASNMAGNQEVYVVLTPDKSIRSWKILLFSLDSKNQKSEFVEALPTKL